MSYNLIAISKSPFDWATVNQDYQSIDQLFEVFPITGLENGDALGISIPTNYFNDKSWKIATKFLTALADSYPLEVYDLYLGHAVDITTYAPDGLEAG
jgi:hypothetical protein